MAWDGNELDCESTLQKAGSEGVNREGGNIGTGNNIVGCRLRSGSVANSGARQGSGD